jgi:hypothetical protein
MQPAAGQSGFFLANGARGRANGAAGKGDEARPDAG